MDTEKTRRRESLTFFLPSIQIKGRQLELQQRFQISNSQPIKERSSQKEYTHLPFCNAWFANFSLEEPLVSPRKAEQICKQIYSSMQLKRECTQVCKSPELMHFDWEIRAVGSFEIWLRASTRTRLKLLYAKCSAQNLIWNRFQIINTKCHPRLPNDWNEVRQGQMVAGKPFSRNPIRALPREKKVADREGSNRKRGPFDSLYRQCLHCRR